MVADTQPVSGELPPTPSSPPKRAAICLSGLVRTYRQTYDNFRDGLLTANPGWQFDIFISTWPTEHSNRSMERTRRIAWTNGLAEPFPENLIDYQDLHTKYHPVVLDIEAPFEFDVPWYVPTPGTNIQSLMSMWYKIWRSDRLRRRHEVFHNFRYEAVIRARFDTMFSFPIKLDDLDLSKIHCPSMMQPRAHPDYDWTNDKFAVSTSINMARYCDWLTYIPILIGRGVPLQPEILLCEHLKQQGLDWLPWGSEMELIRFM